MGLTAAGVAGVLSPSWLRAMLAADVDLVVINAKV